jgi:hypothetical protein
MKKRLVVQKYLHVAQLADKQKRKRQKVRSHSAHFFVWFDLLAQCELPVSRCSLCASPHVYSWYFIGIFGVIQILKNFLE